MSHDGADAWRETRTRAHALVTERQAWFAWGAIALVTVLHYTTALPHATQHDPYRRLYYLPVIYAAVRYGGPRHRQRDHQCSQW